MTVRSTDSFDASLHTTVSTSPSSSRGLEGFSQPLFDDSQEFSGQIALPKRRKIDFSDNARDGFALNLVECGDGLVMSDAGLKEIPAAADDESGQTVVAELYVKEAATQDIFTRTSDDEALTEFEGEDMVGASDSSCDEGGGETSSSLAKRKQIKEEGSSLTAEERIKHAETRLADAVNRVFEQTNLPQRVATTDMKVEFKGKPPVLKAEVKCLLCSIWFKVAWSGYVYKVQNYKRHLSNKHVDTTDTLRTAGKREMKKAQALAGTPAISNFFTSNTASTTPATSTPKRRATIIEIEDCGQANSVGTSSRSTVGMITEGAGLSAPTNDEEPVDLSDEEQVDLSGIVIHEGN